MSVGFNVRLGGTILNGAGSPVLYQDIVFNAGGRYLHTLKRNCYLQNIKRLAFEFFNGKWKKNCHPLFDLLRKVMTKNGSYPKDILNVTRISE